MAAFTTNNFIIIMFTSSFRRKMHFRMKDPPLLLGA
jgi:hypothetical protein